MAYVTAADAKARVPSLTDYSDTIVDATIAEFEDLAERYCQQAFASRTVTEEIVQRPLTSSVALKWPGVTELDSITADGVELDLTNVVVVKAPGVLHGIVWPTWRVLSADAVYTYGPATTQPMIVRGCIEYVRRTLNAEVAGTSRDFRTQAGDGGTTSFVLPDWEKGRPTGFTEVDRILNTYRDPSAFA